MGWAPCEGVRAGTYATERKKEESEERYKEHPGRGSRKERSRYKHRLSCWGSGSDEEQSLPKVEEGREANSHPEANVSETDPVR